MASVPTVTITPKPGYTERDILVANPLVFIPVILIPLAVILISNLVRTIRLAGKIAKDEEEAAVREAIREIQEKRQNEKENSSDKEQ